MPGHVGECLGDDAVRRHLDRCGQVGELARAPTTSTATGWPVPVAQPDRLLPQRRHQAELVERRRSHRVDHPPDLLDRDHGVGAQLGHHLLGRSRVGADQVARRVGGEGHPGQPRSEAVVQLAAQPPPLLLDRRDGLAARLDELLGQRPGAQRSGRAAARSAAAPARRRGRRTGRRAAARPPARRRRRGRGSGCGWSRCPDDASGTPSTSSAAYGMTSASRIARSATTGSAPMRPATVDAAPSGSGRSPKSSSSTTPREQHPGGVVRRRGRGRRGEPARRCSARVRRAARAGRAPARRRTSRSPGPRRARPTRTTRPRTSTRSGSVAPTYIAGATRAKTQVAATGTVLLTTLSAEKAGEEVDEPGSAPGPATSRRVPVAPGPRDTSIRHQVCTRKTQPWTAPSAR